MEERALFDAMISGPDPEHIVLVVHGPGGIGKSTLLRAFARDCASKSVRCVLLDARSFGDSRGSFLAALAGALGVASGEELTVGLAGDGGRVALLVDTFELATELESWMVGEFLPGLPDNVIVVLAGRHPPTDAWRREPGWASLMRPVPLRNLKRADAAEMLRLAGVPEHQRDRLLAPTHGHPLAVSLALELFQMKGGADIDPAESPDIVRTLVERLVMRVPSPSHRLALEATALALSTTEELLGAMLDAPDVSEIFDWLRSLGFMEAHESGLVPHDVAREALAADLRWRNPGQYRELHRRARDFYVAAMQRTPDRSLQRRFLRDLVFLHRDNPVVQPLYQRLRTGTGRADATSEGGVGQADRTAFVEMVVRHEGPEAGRMAGDWLAAYPEALTLFRDDAGRPSGGLLTLDLADGSRGPADTDPAFLAAKRHLAETAPLRPGERGTLFRFWMSAEDYQGLSYVQMAIFVHMVQHYLMTPGLAHTYLPAGEPDELEPVMAYGDIYRIPAADFEIGGRRFGMFGPDWRVCPPGTWLELMGQRQVGAVPDGTRPVVKESVVVLDREDFAEAVHEALKHYSRPRKMTGNPLLKSSLITGRSTGGDPSDRIETLCALLADAVGQLDGTPKLDKAYRALDRTFLRPAGSQEAAAEMVGMPYSTFRRHLGKGVEEVAETLWQMEISAG